MKIYTKVEIDIKTGMVLSEESFEYDGELALCGGSSGGGGSSGSVDYPSYMKDTHKKWLDQIDKYLPAPNPYVNRDAPGIERLTELNVVPYFKHYIDQRMQEARNTNYEPMMKLCLIQPILYQEIIQMICYMLESFEKKTPPTMHGEVIALEQAAREHLKKFDSMVPFLTMQPEYVERVLPRFEAGMRDINAIQMSTFIVGRGILEASYAAKVAELYAQIKGDAIKIYSDITKFISDYKIQFARSQDELFIKKFELAQSFFGVAANPAHGTDNANVSAETTIQQLYAEMHKTRQSILSGLDNLMNSYVGTSIEYERIRTVALFEKATFESDYDEKEARWDLENFQYAGNMLAAIGSGTVSPGNKQPNKMQSALGGALSGAAAGAMVGSAVPGIGTAVGAIGGAIIGGGAALLSSR